MPAGFRRIIHQQAQVSSFETFCGNRESQTIVPLSNILNSSCHLQKPYECWLLIIFLNWKSNPECTQW